MKICHFLLSEGSVVASSFEAIIQIKNIDYYIFSFIQLRQKVDKKKQEYQTGHVKVKKNELRSKSHRRKRSYIQ